jgi:hypothetical protein
VVSKGRAASDLDISLLTLISTYIVNPSPEKTLQGTTIQGRMIVRARIRPQAIDGGTKCLFFVI